MPESYSHPVKVSTLFLLICGLDNGGHFKYDTQNPLATTLYLAEDDANDGRLQVNEVFGLSLNEVTSLVVLSACQTNVGKLSDGDELVGLTRAFIYAGTPSIVASLWNVDDEATTLLMSQFHTYLQQGMDKSEALRHAQIDLRRNYPQFVHPYYWAGFVLTGNSGTIPLPTTSSPPEPISPRLTQTVSEENYGNGKSHGGLCNSVIGSIGLVLLLGLQKKRQQT